MISQYINYETFNIGFSIINPLKVVQNFVFTSFGRDTYAIVQVTFAWNLGVTNLETPGAPDFACANCDRA